MKVTAKRLSQLSEGMQQTSRLLENRLTAGVQKRMQRSFPSINPEDIAADIRKRMVATASSPHSREYRRQT